MNNRPTTSSHKQTLRLRGGAKKKSKPLKSTRPFATSSIPPKPKPVDLVQDDLQEPEPVSAEPGNDTRQTNEPLPEASDNTFLKEYRIAIFELERALTLERIKASSDDSSIPSFSAPRETRTLIRGYIEEHGLELEGPNRGWTTKTMLAVYIRLQAMGVSEGLVEEVLSKWPGCTLNEALQWISVKYDDAESGSYSKESGDVNAEGHLDEEEVAAEEETTEGSVNEVQEEIIVTIKDEEATAETEVQTDAEPEDQGSKITELDSKQWILNNYNEV
jgi:hypothetical protein